MAPPIYGPRKPPHNRHVRWTRDGVFARLSATLVGTAGPSAGRWRLGWLEEGHHLVVRGDDEGRPLADMAHEAREVAAELAHADPPWWAV